MLKEALARRYAQALFEISVQKDLEKIEAELQEITKLTEQNAEVARFLNHPHIPLSEKKALIDKLFDEQLTNTVRNFLYLLIDRRRQVYLSDILGEFSKLADESRNVVEVKVTSAVSLTENQESRLQKELARITGKTVRMVKEVRPELIGGVLVQVGDRVIDGTVVYKLSQIRKSLSQV